MACCSSWCLTCGGTPSTGVMSPTLDWVKLVHQYDKGLTALRQGRVLAPSAVSLSLSNSQGTLEWHNGKRVPTITQRGISNGLAGSVGIIMAIKAILHIWSEILLVGKDDFIFVWFTYDSGSTT